MPRSLEAAYTGVRFGDIAQRNFTLARTGDIMFDVVQRMAIVASGEKRWHASQIVGIISKEHVADSVVESIRPFG